MAFKRLEGKTALITGASAGIGAATAQLFAQSGANLILAARRVERLEDVKKAALEANKNITVDVYQLDASKVADINAFVDKLKGKKIDILLNNAGGVRGVEAVGDISPDDVDIMISLNMTGLIHLTQLVLSRFFKPQSSGHIINLGSIAGRDGYEGGAIYCATKAAVRSFSQTLIKELVSTPIRVSEIQPGLVNTEFSTIRFRGDKDKADAVYKGLQPLTGEDIAEEIAWIASRPEHVNIAETLVFPVSQAAAKIVHKPHA